MNWKSIFQYRDGVLYWIDEHKNGVKAGYVAGRLCAKDGRFDIKVNGKCYSRSRIVWEIHFGSIPAGLYVDHINGNTSDDRVSNLRLATPSQNSFNKSLPKSNSSGFKGVTWNKSCKKWQVLIHKNKKPIYLGVYSDIELADLVASEAREKYFGEFNRSNS